MPLTKAFDIRPAVLEDKYEIARLGKEFVKEANLLHRLGFDWKVFIEFLEKIIPSETFLVFVAEVEGEIVGFIIAGLMPTFFSGTLQATELAWYVHPDHRQSRIAHRLHGMYEEWAREEGAIVCNMMHMETDKAEKIGKMYGRLGYTKSETAYMKELN